jgi:hypothetical protein
MRNFSKKSSGMRKEESRKAFEEHKVREERFRLENKKRKKKKSILLATTVIFLLILGAWITYAATAKGEYDEFAQCLTEKGVVMYGEDWCKYTQGQKAMFGKSFKYIDYQVKTDLQIRPTWIIDGKEYKKVQSFQTLSALTGCNY